MITKAIIRSINSTGSRCIVRMPLFESASDLSPVEAEALVSITPGFFNNLFVGDVVLVSFEENALEKPIILGKLYKGTSFENETPGGMGIVDKLMVRTEGSMPGANTFFRYPSDQGKPEHQQEYKNFVTPKKIADYILWLEKLTKKLTNQLEKNFKCFKDWTQWQLRPENVEIDDGNLDAKGYVETEAFKYQEENNQCAVCTSSVCTKANKREYVNLDIDDKIYPKI